MLLKILIYGAVLYLIQRFVRDLLFPRRPDQRVRGRKTRTRVIDPANTDIEDARYRDVE